MLGDTFRQQIVAAIQAEARNHTTEAIYSDPDVLLQMQEHIGAGLKEWVNRVLGGEFFCGPTFRADRAGCPEFTFVIKEITLPIQAQYNANRAAALAVDEARIQAERRQAEAKGEADRQAALRSAPELTAGQLDYIRAQAQLECARRPDCILVVGGAAPSVQVAPGSRGP